MLLLFLPLPLLIKIYKFCDITSAYLIREPSCAQVPTVNGGIYYVEIRTQVFVESAALHHNPKFIVVGLSAQCCVAINKDS
jgi:hypothetical protein